MPAQSSRSFTPIGTPANGPGSRPSATAASTASAAARATRSSTCTNAPNSTLRASMAANASSSTSVARRWPVLTASAISTAPTSNPAPIAPPRRGRRGNTNAGRIPARTLRVGRRRAADRQLLGDHARLGEEVDDHRAHRHGQEGAEDAEQRAPRRDGDEDHQGVELEVLAEDPRCQKVVVELLHREGDERDHDGAVESGGHERHEDRQYPGDDGADERDERGEEGHDRDRDGELAADQPHRRADDEALDDAERRRALEVTAEGAPRPSAQAHRQVAPMLGETPHEPWSEAVAVLEDEERRDHGEQDAGKHLEHEDRAADQGAALRLEHIADALVGLFAELLDVLARDVERAVLDHPVLDVVDGVLDRGPEVVELRRDRRHQDGEDAGEHDQEPEQHRGRDQRPGPAMGPQEPCGWIEGAGEERRDRGREQQDPELRHHPQDGQPDDPDADQPPAVGAQARDHGMDADALSRRWNGIGLWHVLSGGRRGSGCYDSVHPLHLPRLLASSRELPPVRWSTSWSLPPRRRAHSTTWSCR